MSITQMKANKERYEPTSEDDEFRYELKSEDEDEDETSIKSLTLSSFFTGSTFFFFLSLVRRYENERVVVVLYVAERG